MTSAWDLGVVWLVVLVVGLVGGPAWGLGATLAGMVFTGMYLQYRLTR